MLNEFADPQRAPEVLSMRDRIRSWRFYDYFRTDATAPARRSQIATRTPVLANDGADLAAALQTIREIGNAGALDAAVDLGFPGSQLASNGIAARASICACASTACSARSVWQSCPTAAPLPAVDRSAADPTPAQPARAQRA
jgi:hypothetical protein